MHVIQLVKISMRLFLGIFFVTFSIQLIGQSNDVYEEGVVTFKASDNVYVRFTSTDKMEIGDTIFLKNATELLPCLVITKKSSTSCICESLENCAVSKNDKVIYSKKQIVIISAPTTIPANTVDPVLEEQTSEILMPEITAENNRVQQISGSLSAASYSNLSSLTDGDTHRAVGRMSLNIFNINGSKLSFESYLNYNKNFYERTLEAGTRTSFFNAYNLALTYDVDSSMFITIGRKINRNISSIGPIDGLQVEKNFGHIIAGAVVGFKPDLRQFGFNADLFEYGAYIGHRYATSIVRSTTTIGLLEQTNQFTTDRRYTYLQHSSTYGRKLTLFSSIEIDVFEKLNGVTSTKPRMTNLYTSAQYRFSRKFSLTASYDARKRIIYYETFRTDVERILEDDETRQGVRIRMNASPIKYVNLGVSYGKRFKVDSQEKSDNVNGYLSYSKVPVVGGSISFNGNINQTNYSKSIVYGVRYSRKIINKYLDGNIYYRKYDSEYISSENKTSQTYYGANLTVRLSKTLRLSILGEYSEATTRDNTRINTKLIKRFKK